MRTSYCRFGKKYYLCSEFFNIMFNTTQGIMENLQALITAAADMLAAGVQPQSVAESLISGGVTASNAYELVIQLIMSA